VFLKCYFVRNIIDCTSEQLDAKIEFLMRRNELLKNEKDALEMYAIKTKPELMNTCKILKNFLMYYDKCKCKCINISYCWHFGIQTT